MHGFWPSLKGFTADATGPTWEAVSGNYAHLRASMQDFTSQIGQLQSNEVTVAIEALVLCFCCMSAVRYNVLLIAQMMW